MGSASRRCPTLRAARRRVASCWASRPVPMSRAPRVRVSLAAAAVASDNDSSSPLAGAGAQDGTSAFLTSVFPSFLPSSQSRSWHAWRPGRMATHAIWWAWSRTIMPFRTRSAIAALSTRKSPLWWVSSSRAKPSQPSGKQDETFARVLIPTPIRNLYRRPRNAQLEGCRI